MTLKKGKWEKLTKTVRLHVNWFMAALLGEETLSKSEREELSKFKALPTERLNLPEKAFLLGRLKSIFKKSEWKDLNWESLLDSKSNLTSLEKLALEQAKARAAKSIRSLTGDLLDEINDALVDAGEATLTEASLRSLIDDEVAIAKLEKQNYKKVASELAKRTKTSLNPRWIKISRTELQASKVQGSVQAIINKLDVYSKSKGIDAQVSVVPSSGTCPDCAKHYLDNSGNPKVYKLRTLLSSGDNFDAVHTMQNGVHTRWKAVLPPMHPGCNCEVKYVPPGYSWVAGKLTLTNREALVKAIGDSALSATQKPAGPKSPDGSKGGSPPSIPGIKSPGQKTPPKSPGGSETASTDTKMPCPFGGGDNCAKHSGGLSPKGADSHEPDSAVMEAHRKALAQGVKPTDPEAAKQLLQRKSERAQAWADTPDHKVHAVAMDHLSNSAIETIAPLQEEFGGVAQKFKVTLEGNGPALLKPPHKMSAEVKAGTSWTEGASTLPYDSGHASEAACYDMHVGFGLKDHVPPTVMRTVSEAGMVEGDASLQRWEDGFHATSSWVKSEQAPASDPSEDKTAELGPDGAPIAPGDDLKPVDPVKPKKAPIIHILEEAPREKRAALLEKISEGLTMALVGNHQDLHGDNMLYNPDTHDVRFIDGTGFGGNGMHDTKCAMHMDLHNRGRLLKVPPKLLEKFSKTSFGDVKRMSGKLSDWQQGQTFLRMKYVEHLQKAEGHLDYKKFQSTWTTKRYGAMPRKPFWDSDEGSFGDRESAGTLPSQLFDSFAKAWMDKHAGDESSPHHADAKELQELGVFMPASTSIMENPKAYRKSGAHKEYEKGIKPNWPEHAFPAPDGNNNPMDDYEAPERILSDEEAAPTEELKIGPEKPAGSGPEDSGPEEPEEEQTAAPPRRRVKKAFPLYVRLDH